MVAGLPPQFAPVFNQVKAIVKHLDDKLSGHIDGNVTDIGRVEALITSTSARVDSLERGMPPVSQAVVDMGTSRSSDFLGGFKYASRVLRKFVRQRPLSVHTSGAQTVDSWKT